MYTINGLTSGVSNAHSSLQGLKFLSALTVEVANALQISEAETGLRRAEQPLSFIKDVDTGLAEFAQRLFYEVAASILPDLPAIPGPEAARMALAAALRRRLENDEAWQTFSSVEKEQTFIAAANAFERAVAQEDRALAVRALGGLLEVALARFDYSEAGGLAGRLWAGTGGGPVGRTAE